MDNLNCNTRRIKIITARGTISAELTSITNRCHVITAGDETRQYRSAAGALSFLEVLTARLIFAPRFPLLPAPSIKAVALAAFIRRTAPQTIERKAA